MLTAAELREKAESLRNKAGLQLDAGAADAYRELAQTYKGLAVNREMSADGLKAILFETFDLERAEPLG